MPSTCWNIAKLAASTLSSYLCVSVYVHHIQNEMFRRSTQSLILIYLCVLVERWWNYSLHLMHFKHRSVISLFYLSVPYWFPMGCVYTFIINHTLPPYSTCWALQFRILYVGVHGPCPVTNKRLHQNYLEIHQSFLWTLVRFIRKRKN